MIWELAHKGDARVLAQSPGSPTCAPPGRVVVLYAPGAFWISLWQEHADHDHPDAWVNSAFRREGAARGAMRASRMIQEAVAATRWQWPEPTRPMITFVDPLEVRQKAHPGFCYLRAGFELVGETKGGHGRTPKLVFRLDPSRMPSPAPARGAQLALGVA